MGITARLRRWCGVPLLLFSAVALADNAMTTESADLYAGPDDSYPVVAELDSNSPVQVMGCLDDWSWCDVVAADTRGWMYAPDITYGYQGGYVPLYTYAPSLGIAVVPFTLDAYWGRYYHSRPWYSQRTEWEHREVRHRRPSGPPPHAGPIPREAARADHRDVHLGSAEPRHEEHGSAAAEHRIDADRRAEADRRADAEHRADAQHRAEADHRAEAERRDNADRNMSRRPEPPRPAGAPRSPEPPRPETHAMPAPPHPTEHAPAHEQHPPGPGRAAPAPHEDHPHDDHPH